MIDTDKYEGHTEGEWLVVEVGISRVMVYTNDKDFSMASANRNLIADAPHLLTEVKRLHEALQEIIDDFETQKTDLWTMRNRIETILKGEE